MNKKVEVSYNPQVGYLQTIFKHDFDFLTAVREYVLTDHGVEFSVDTRNHETAAVIIQCLSDTSVRVQMYPPREREAFNNEVFSLVGSADYRVTEDEEYVHITKGRVEVRIRKCPWEAAFYLDGALKTKEHIGDSNVDNMCKNLPIGFTYGENKKVSSVHETMYLYSDEEFYGFGEKFTDFGKRGQCIHCWQTDALSTNTEASYKNHPFFMSSRGYAILLNTFTRSQMDMGTVSNVAYNLKTEDSYLDYVIWMEKDYKTLLQSYIGQTGGTPMIPKWAFGLWMSKCSYGSEAEIRGVVEKAEARGLKIDVIHIDRWQTRMDNGVWEWDYENFPDPKRLVDYLKDHGIRLCLWIFPYLCEHSKYFEFVKEKGFLVKNREGGPALFHATATSDFKVACFDFTNPEFIAWYRPRVKAVLELGIGAVKTDFSEAVPEDAVYFDGSNGIQGHNKLTYLYAKTIYDIQKEVKDKTGERPMLWGRSGFAGSHTIPAAWAGDSSTHLNNHACILRGGLSASMSGIPFWGFDIGGFYNTDHEGYECVPTDEEYIRSAQFGLLNGLARCHGKTPREPWNFGTEAERIFGEFNQLRHRLLPYLYSTAYETHKELIPMLRPVIMEYPSDRSAREVELEYFLGDSLLVAPVFDQDAMEVYLPEGEWVDWFTGDFVSGGRWIQIEKKLDRIPVYIRENRMIPCLTEIPKNIDCRYENLNVILFVKDEMDAVYYDDDVTARLHAKVESGILNLSSELPAGKMTVYTEETIQEVYVNGVKTEFSKDGKAYLILIK